MQDATVDFGLAGIRVSSVENNQTAFYCDARTGACRDWSRTGESGCAVVCDRAAGTCVEGNDLPDAGIQRDVGASHHENIVTNANAGCSVSRIAVTDLAAATAHAVSAKRGIASDG